MPKRIGPVKTSTCKLVYEVTASPWNYYAMDEFVVQYVKKLKTVDQSPHLFVCFRTVFCGVLSLQPPSPPCRVFFGVKTLEQESKGCHCNPQACLCRHCVPFFRANFRTRQGRTIPSDDPRNGWRSREAAFALNFLSLGDRFCDFCGLADSDCIVIKVMVWSDILPSHPYPTHPHPHPPHPHPTPPPPSPTPHHAYSDTPPTLPRPLEPTPRQQHPTTEPATATVNMYKYILFRNGTLKGTVSRDFCFWFLFMNQFPPSPRVFH
jgi:hypothetical protein